MKIEQLLNEHKKGVKAKIYNKKPKPLVGPEALKAKAKAKVAPPKTELEKHSKLSAKLEGVQDKLHKRHQELRKKSGLPNPDYYKELKTTFDLPDEERHAKAAELKKKYKVKDMKEAKQSEAPKPRNFVAKNAKTAGAGVHKDAKKASKDVRGQKHKNKEIAEGEWSQQSDEMIPPEYDMDPDELSQIRNAPAQDDETIAQIVKMSAKGINNDQIANYFDMDQEEVENILNQHINDVKSQIDETEMGKIVDYKPGQTATLNTGPGMTTIIDLKKNPTSLTKDPQTGKLTLVSTPQTTAQPSATAQPTIKAGDAVEIGKTTEDILKLAGLR